MFRRKFKINGQHAETRLLGRRKTKKLGFLGQHGIVQRTAKQQLPVSYSATICLANLLYPKHFPRIISSGLDKKTSFSQLAEIDNASKKAISSFYRRSAPTLLGDILRKFDKLRRGPTQYEKHMVRVFREAANVGDTIEKESGIAVNTQSMNVGFRNKNPVFFEIHAVEIEKLRPKIEAMPEGRRKQQAIALFELIESSSSGRTIIYPHRPGYREGLT